METRANYILIGVFTLAVIAGVFGFVYWFQNIGGTGERLFYRVVFDGSVSGLRTGATVLFNGIRVGEVTGLRLDPSKPKQVIATLSVDKSVTVRDDTQIGLEFQGLTGIASISLIGGSPAAKVVAGVGAGETPPLMVAPPGATQDVTQAARDVMRKLDEFITENQQSFHATLANIEAFTATLKSNSENIDKTLASIQQFTAALGRNSDRIDHIAQGLESLTGGPDGKGGDINEAAKSIKQLADNLDKRTAEITANLNGLTRDGSRQIDALSSDARRTLGTIDRAVKNLDRNPSRLIFGGSGGGSLPEYRGR
ncbi:MAG: MCE family protein [Proteobacteria bacterium]|nr:MCE family protein [Pseudomonadota bacterium]